MSLVEDVENIVVEALAQQDRFARNNRLPVTPEMASYLRSGHMPTEPDSSVVTRDIILAVADKLDSWMALYGYGHHGASQLDWLRSQANPDSAESD